MPRTSNKKKAERKKQCCTSIPEQDLAAAAGCGGRSRPQVAAAGPGAAVPVAAGPTTAAKRASRIFQKQCCQKFAIQSDLLANSTF